jgi:hypothetical protein
MTPDVGSVLNGIVRSLMFELAPELQSPYATQTIQLSAGLLMMVNEEFDRAAARLAEENDALVALFAGAAASVNHELAAQLRAEVSRGRGDSLLVSALRERNRSLRRLLVRLHEHVESVDDAAARAVEERIWRELAESTRRRQLALANG